MLHIPAPTVQDRANQWAEAYNAAERLIANAFKYNPQLMCYITEVSLKLVIIAIAEQHAIPIQIIGAATLTAAQDLHEQYHNPV